MKTNCGKCHECGTALKNVLDGEEWCPKCKKYRRYITHGWNSCTGEESPCTTLPINTLPDDINPFNLLYRETGVE